jgi:hypothetical protein
MYCIPATGVADHRYRWPETNGHHKHSNPIAYTRV